MHLMQLEELGDRNFGSPPVWSRDKAPLGRRSPPEAEAFCTFAHNILTPHNQKLGVSGHRGHQWIDCTAGGSGGCSSSGIQGRAPVKLQLCAAQVADFCLIRRFLWGIEDFRGNIPPIDAYRINTVGQARRDRTRPGWWREIQDLQFYTGVLYDVAQTQAQFEQRTSIA